jgi:putative membrane protein
MIVWPTVNAALNATSAVLLLCGYRAIRRKAVAIHTRCMLAACTASVVFFVSYALYHLQVGATPFEHRGWVRPVYFAILISHTVLAVAIVPLVIRTVWLALHDRLAPHRRLARITLPLWLYVCVTGVVVYGMLYHL